MRSLLPSRSLGCALLLAGCGPEAAEPPTWIVDTFSNHRVGATNVSSVTYYEFREDGSLVVSGVTNKGKSTGPVTYTWAQEDGNVVVVRLPEPDPLTFADTWRFADGADCKTIEKQSFKGDSPEGSNILFRGEVCIHLFEEMCPIGLECDSSETRWCEEPPPPCPGSEDAR